MPGLPQSIVESLERATPDAALRIFELVDAAGLDGESPLSRLQFERATVPYGWLLQRVGDDGIRLTAAGYLPPEVVSQAMTELGWADEWFGKHNREIQTAPILRLRTSAQAYGLLRRRQGVLMRTAIGRRASEDAELLWHHIAARIIRSKYPAVHDATVLLLLLVAAREIQGWWQATIRLADLMNLHGWRTPHGDPLLHPQVYDLVRDTWDTLTAIGVFGSGRRLSDDRVSVTEEGAAFARVALRR